MLKLRGRGGLPHIRSPREVDRLLHNHHAWQRTPQGRRADVTPIRVVTADHRVLVGIRFSLILDAVPTSAPSRYGPPGPHSCRD
jgi:hypothetical protein